MNRHLAINIETFLQLGPLKCFSISLYKIYIKVYARLKKKSFYKFFSSSDFSTIISYLHGSFVKVHCKAYPEKSFMCGYLIAHKTISESKNPAALYFLDR